MILYVAGIVEYVECLRSFGEINYGLEKGVGGKRPLRLGHR